MALQRDNFPRFRVHFGPLACESQETRDRGTVDVGVEDGDAEARARQGDGEVDY